MLLVGSAPQYPQGVIDPIEEIAALAAARNINCHVDACMGGDLEGLLALLDPAVEGRGDAVPGVRVGAAQVAPGILRYLGPPTSPTLLHLPVGDRIGIVAMRDRRVLALILLTVDNGAIVHVDALAGEAPRAAVTAALGLR